uniref:MAK10-like protein n=1 Tax=Tanacetum cinerariifolium TaxID=118510 RepID=A0A6L2MYS5_TANCI|nr:MAK10-like protein [Tanacetum cinerariifolium]
MGDANRIRTLRDYSKPSHEGYRNTTELPVGNNVDPSPHGRILLLVYLLNSFHREGLRTIDQSTGGKLRDRNAKESWALLEDIALYDNESWNDLRDFANPVKAISLPQDVPSTSDCRLIELENQVQRLMEGHIAPMQPTQVNKITSSCEICSGPHDTQYCMENPKQAFVEYASPRTNEAREFVCTKGDDGDVMFIEIVKTNDDSRKEEPKAGRLEVEYFDIFPTPSKLAYHKYLMCGPIPSIYLRNLIITGGCPSNLKIPCNIGHIMRRKLDPRENSDRGVSNFTGRIKEMHVFVGNFTYVTNFMIFEDINSVIDPRLSKVVLRKPFVEISNMTHDPPEDLEKEHMKSVYLRNEEVEEEEWSTFLALGWHLKEIHVTWDHLEKKRTRVRLYTIYLEELCIQSVETASQAQSDAVAIYLVTASGN